MENRLLPIGIQDFEKLRIENCLYADKTQFIWQLVTEGSVYFLSRPRRFGKSLFLSTLKAYFEGKKELFDGLYIAEKETQWTKYPVFYFDFNSKKYKDAEGLSQILNSHFEAWENIYGKEKQDRSLDERFAYLLRTAHEKTGLRVVVLVDEYDKSMIESKKENLDDVKFTFKSVFGNLKSCDEHIKFVFITGVTKFTKVSIFSDLNHLEDISLAEKYSEICGFTEEEIRQKFMIEIEETSLKHKISVEECINKLKSMYDGYHFSETSFGMYNPFSLLNALKQQNFDPYWFETGTPTFLVEKMRATNYKVQDFSLGLRRRKTQLKDYIPDNVDLAPLLYQTGYLTIKGFDSEYNQYILKYPNNEVQYAFLDCLAPAYLPEPVYDSGVFINHFCDDLKNGEPESLMNRLKSLFAALPYTANENETVTEYNFQCVIYLVFMISGQFVNVEYQTSFGRADCVVKTAKNIYLFEFKRDKSAEEALNQIEEKNYAQSFLSDERKLYKIGANFSTSERNLTEWKIVKGE